MRASVNCNVPLCLIVVAREYVLQANESYIIAPVLTGKLSGKGEIIRKHVREYWNYNCALYASGPHTCMLSMHIFHAEKGVNTVMGVLLTNLQSCCKRRAPFTNGSKPKGWWFEIYGVPPAAQWVNLMIFNWSQIYHWCGAVGHSTNPWKKTIVNDGIPGSGIRNKYSTI